MSHIDLYDRRHTRLDTLSLAAISDGHVSGGGSSGLGMTLFLTHQFVKHPTQVTAQLAKQHLLATLWNKYD